jgi:hypothetical protein
VYSVMVTSLAKELSIHHDSILVGYTELSE